jgi:hypothetical protein
MACFEKLEKKIYFKGAKGWRFERPHLPSFEGHHVQIQIEYEESIKDFVGCTSKKLLMTTVEDLGPSSFTIIFGLIMIVW